MKTEEKARYVAARKWCQGIDYDDPTESAPNEVAEAYLSVVPELLEACEASFMDHYSERSGLSSCPCSSDPPATDDLCDCGAAKHNAMLTAVISKAKGLSQ